MYQIYEKNLGNFQPVNKILLRFECGTWNSNLKGTLMSKQWRKNCRAQNDATPALDLWPFFYKMKPQFKLKSISFFIKTEFLYVCYHIAELKNLSSKMWFVTYLCVTKKPRFGRKSAKIFLCKPKNSASFRFEKAHQKLLLKQKIQLSLLDSYILLLFF